MGVSPEFVKMILWYVLSPALHGLNVKSLLGYISNNGMNNSYPLGNECPLTGIVSLTVMKSSSLNILLVINP